MGPKLALFFVVWTCLNITTGFAAKRFGIRRTVDGSNWMKQNIHILGRKTLKQICLPGSHDSGMSEYNRGTTLGHPCNVLTQSVPIREQLGYGARYFDVRPVLGNRGQFLTGHYIKLPGGSWQGGNGQSIESIVKDINQFIATQSELVIINLSHTLNTDVGNTKYRPFNPTEWDKLFQILDKTNNLYVSNGTVHLPSITLNEFTNYGRKGAVFYIIDEPGVNLGSRLGKGYFYNSNIGTYNNYSNTNDFTKMSKDQISKMKAASKDHYFLLSWTLTQGGTNAALCIFKKGKTIKDFSNFANSRLRDILPEVNPSAFPNVLYLDDIRDCGAVSVAMEINRKL